MNIEKETNEQLEKLLEICQAQNDIISELMTGLKALDARVRVLEAEQAARRGDFR